MTQQLSKVTSDVIVPTILIILNILAWLPSDMHIPLMPLMAADFLVSTNTIQLTVSFFLLGYCATPLVHGILSDYLGRRTIILSGLTLAVMGSLLCAVIHDMTFLFIGRLLQGIGAAACLCVPRAILRDLYSGKKMSQILSWIAISTEISVALAPPVSAYMADRFGWHSCFYALVCLTFLMLVLSYYFLPETNPASEVKEWRLSAFWRELKTIITNWQFIVFALSGGLSLAVIMAYLTVSPFILQETLHLSVTAYGLSTLAVNGSILAGVFGNMILLRRLKLKGIMLLGLVTVLFGSIAVIGTAAFIPLSVLSVILPSSIAIIGSGLIFANSSVGALVHFPQSAGTASAIYTMIQLSVAFLATGALALSDYDNLLGVGVCCLFLSVLTLSAFVAKYSQIKL